ncbi:MAG: type II toxin-antitoxin system VapC family toxin [Actinobacteria bacterium]|nr:type II toxin-antitoxin system VapC family toxin [Actinomycetota bacterium]MDQ3530987.1 type II toxin-antitoxin system VapC family toxin [Actinomycetota bacterium]
MRGERAAYLDSSALVKLVIAETESVELRRFLRGHPVRVSCGLARVEVPRAVRRHGAKAVSRARRLLATINLLTLDDALLVAAADLDATVLRALDAIHLAAAYGLGDRLEALVTYDGRMAEAAEILELPITAPR